MSGGRIAPRADAQWFIRRPGREDVNPKQVIGPGESPEALLPGALKRLVGGDKR
jgi:hypothetical protein